MSFVERIIGQRSKALTLNPICSKCYDPARSSLLVKFFSDFHHPRPFSILTKATLGVSPVQMTPRNDSYFCYDNRIRSFPANWLRRDEVARVGLYLYRNWDVKCFFCENIIRLNLGDDPLTKHLQSSTECNWALMLSPDIRPREESTDWEETIKVVRSLVPLSLPGVLKQDR